MYKTPLGERRPQPTGYWLKTLKDINKARIWWAPTSDPALYEDTLLEAFIKAAGAPPYAVLVRPGGQGRDHGLTAPLHDDEAAKRVKVTKVTRLPDADEEAMLLSMSRSNARPPLKIKKTITRKVKVSLQRRLALRQSRRPSFAAPRRPPSKTGAGASPRFTSQRMGSRRSTPNYPS
jgi:hypothetical protein